MGLFSKNTVLDEMKKEHEEFRARIKQIKESNGQRQEKCFKELYLEITTHHKAEEATDFKSVMKRGSAKDKDVVREMIEEHHLIEHQCKRCVAVKMADETWKARFNVLAEVLESHLKEEEDEFFEIANKDIPDDILEKQRSIFEAKQQELEKKYHDKIMGLKLR